MPLKLFYAKNRQTTDIIITKKYLLTIDTEELRKRNQKSSIKWKEMMHDKWKENTLNAIDECKMLMGCLTLLQWVLLLPTALDSTSLYLTVLKIAEQLPTSQMKNVNGKFAV